MRQINGISFIGWTKAAEISKFRKLHVDELLSEKNKSVTSDLKNGPINIEFRRIIYIGFNDLDISKFLIFLHSLITKTCRGVVVKPKISDDLFYFHWKTTILWKRNHSVQQILCLNEIINVFVWRCNWLQGANISRNVQLMGYSSPKDGHRIVCNLCKEFPSMVFHSCPVKFKDDFLFVWHARSCDNLRSVWERNK